MINCQEQTYLLDEEMLILQAMQGDLEAFNQLILSYQNMAYHHARALLGDPASAEDAAQEGFVKAFQNMKGFRGGSFRGWLLRIVTNTAYDILRRVHRHPTQPLLPEDENGEKIESAAWLADPASPVQDKVEQRELSTCIHKALGDLPGIYRTILTLIDIDEFEYAEAAQIVKVPVGTVKSRLARARLRMQAKLRDGKCASLPIPYVVRNPV